MTKVDGATWTAGTWLPVGSGRYDRLEVRAGGGAAWVVSQGGTVVQQLDPQSMTLIGAPQTLPGAVRDVAVAPDGRLWAVAASGEVRSFRDGKQATDAVVTDPGDVALTLIGDRPVVVDLERSRATLVDPDGGEADRRLCLDLATTTPPVIGGAGTAPWLLAVAPATGTLVVSDLDADRCQVVPIGPTGTGPRYGTPVEKDRLVFVPDSIAGQVIVVDPAAPTGQQVKARIELGLADREIALRGAGPARVVQRGRWRLPAGVITDDLKARVVSKVEGASQSEAPQAPPRPQDGPGGAAVPAVPPAAPERRDQPRRPAASPSPRRPCCPRRPAPRAQPSCRPPRTRRATVVGAAGDGGGGGGDSAPAPPPA